LYISIEELLFDGCKEGIRSKATIAKRRMKKSEMISKKIIFLSFALSSSLGNLVV
jgi:hypothetical protein